MPRFPSLEWCRAVEAVVVLDPATPAAVKEWGNATVGVIIGSGDGLAKDFCLYIAPHPTELKLKELKLCEDEDDLELEEPDYLFRVPFGICRQIMEKRLDPFEVVRKGQVRIVGDMKKLLAFGQKHQAIGDRVLARIETVF
jgi:hypothetical protein